MLEIAVQILRVSIILRGHEPRLHEIGPSIAFEVSVPAPTHPVVVGAVLELADAVVLAAERDESVDGRAIAALDVGAQELAALGKA